MTLPPTSLPVAEYEPSDMTLDAIALAQRIRPEKATTKVETRQEVHPSEAETREHRSKPQAENAA